MNKILAILLSLALGVTACAPVSQVVVTEPTATELPVEPKEEEAAKVELAENLLEIKLDENPSTGYTWQLKAGGTGIVKCIDDGYSATVQNGEVLAGGGGVHRWVFEGVKPGTDVLEFDLGQHWEGGEQKETKLIEIRVDDNLAPAIVDAETEPTEPAPVQTPDAAKTSFVNVSLEENPTSGYVWSVSYEPLDSFKMVEDTLKLPEASQPDGTPGTHNWKFARLKEGDAKIIFSYSRPWESKMPIKTVTCNVSAAGEVKMEESGELPAAAELDQTQMLLDSVAYAIKMSGKKEFDGTDPQIIWSVLYDMVSWMGEKGLQGVQQVETSGMQYFVTEENLAKNIYYMIFSKGELPKTVTNAPFYGNIEKKDGGYYFAVSDKGDNNASFRPEGSLNLTAAADQAVMVRGEIVFYGPIGETYGYTTHTLGAFLLRPNPTSYGGYALETFTSIIA